MSEIKLKQVKVRYTCEFDVVLREDENLTEDKLKQLSKEIQSGTINSSFPVHFDVTEADKIKTEIISEAVDYVG